ncbi:MULTISPECIES: polysaccharide biosynthesis/export family protein [Rhodomicrobium]|uniref:polysaccharide biosynthesis/export family protein n=1 Tax=Rhodomicrobium TaxID=1068 RepID=UPI000F73FA52|nr:MULTISPECIES: polysaccharide biosynthesis/export family protein [Rhodomicrobium]
MLGALKIVAMVAAVSGLAACGGTAETGDTTTTSALPGTAYALAPGDRLKINVFDEPNLTGEFQIDENGKIAFPLVGEIRAGGFGLDDFRLSLIEHLKGGYVRNPRVTIDILNYRPINIIGEVKNPGQFPYRPGISAQDIAAIAGGYTYRANESTIYIIRNSSKNPIPVKVDDGHFPILPGDSIKIPERFF